MNIISKYFDFKKRNLVNYALVFIDDKDKSDAEEYLNEFIQTYINTRYYHILDTYYDKVITKFDDKIMIKELKGKRLELLAEVKGSEDEKAKEALINRCYQYTFISIILDLSSFPYCTRLVEFKESLRENLVENKKVMANDEEKLDAMSALVKDSTLKERKFFSDTKNDTFEVNYYSYKNSSTKYKVILDYDIEQLEKNYSKSVLSKNYNSEKISLDKTKATINLVGVDLLNRMLNGKEINDYFIDLPLTDIEKREDLEDLVKSFNNPRVRNNIVFIINYNDYKTHKSLFKNLQAYRFALSVNLSRVIVIEKRLAEIESFDIFKYVIIEGVKKEDAQLVENYVIKGKETFSSELNMM